ncbi:MAG: adenosine deaminase, partial [Pseudonocardiales bacterium]|nr:adenosine deaminase [Pseudonocardiales bacterium]
MPVALSSETIRDAPKVLLHDHLDGGLRAESVIELAQDIGYRALPSEDATELSAWFLGAAHSGSLVRYLETFGHTVAVMQSVDALVRVASECAQDLAADGVVYAEVRFAPELHVEQ